MEKTERKKKRNFEKGSISLAELLWMTIVFVIAMAIIVQLTVAVTGMQWAHVYSRNHGMISVVPHEFDFKLLSMDTIDLISNFISNLGSVEGIFTSVFTGNEGVGDASRKVKVPVLIPFGKSFGAEEIELNKDIGDSLNKDIGDSRLVWGYYGIRID